MKVDKTIQVKMETSIGVMEVDCNVTLEDVGKDFKVSISIGDKINNHHIFRKKDIEKLSNSLNSNLFKGMKGFDTEQILSTIKDLEKDLNIKIEQQQYMINKEYEKTQNKILVKGKKFYDYCKYNNILPSNYIMKASRWKVAGEEINTLKLVLSILSTMRGQPINLISIAAAGSGKSIIEDAAFSMVNPDNYMILNFSTPAAFKNACINNPYLFSNKMIRYGDLGATISEEVMAEVNSIIKILNSEGYYKASKMLGDEVIDIELIGRCGMAFSKVENSIPLDVQDSSRSVLWLPRIDNDKAFQDFYTWLDFKTTDDFEYEDKIFDNIRNYLDWLASLEIEVINPYKDALDDLFKGNEAYRRLLNKQDSILKMLALLNLPSKPIIDNNRIYVNNQDFEMYYKLFHKSLIALREFDVRDADIDFYNTLASGMDTFTEDDVYQGFIELLDINNSDFYDEHFMYNNSFFTVNDIVNNMSNVRSVYNIIGNVESFKNKRSKVREALKRLENFIGRFYIPDDNWKGRGQKPTLYYIRRVDAKDKKVEYFIRKRTFNIIYEYYGEEDVKRIINDMKEHCPSFKKRGSKLVGCIEDINDKSVFNCPVIDNPKYMELEDIDLERFL